MSKQRFDFSQVFEDDKKPKKVISVSIDPEILTRFQEACKGSVSGAVERLMELALELNAEHKEDGDDSAGKDISDDPNEPLNMKS